MNKRRFYDFACTSINYTFTGKSNSEKERNYQSAIPDFLPIDLIRYFKKPIESGGLGFSHIRLSEIAGVSRETLYRIEKEPYCNKGRRVKVEKYIREYEVNPSSSSSKIVKNWNTEKYSHPGWPAQLIDPVALIVKKLCSHPIVLNELIFPPFDIEETFQAVKSYWLFRNLVLKHNSKSEDLILFILDTLFQNWRNEKTPFVKKETQNLIHSFLRGKDLDRFEDVATCFWHLSAIRNPAAARIYTERLNNQHHATN